MTTLYEKKQSLSEVGAQLKAVNDKISRKAGDPTVADSVLEQLSQQSESLEKRFNMLKAQIDRDEKEAKMKAKLNSENSGTPKDPKELLVDAKAAFYRGGMKQLTPEYKQALSIGNGSNGENFLPKTVANDVVTDPVTTNPLRADETITNVTNLERPILDVTIDDDSFVADEETAKELQAKGGTIQFDSHKGKYKVGLSETVLNGTNTNLVNHVESKLQEALAVKEKMVAFAAQPKSGEEKMSFYSTQNNIKHVKGDTMFDAITSAAADIADGFQSDVKVYMTRPDYIKMVKELSNGAVSLFGKTPEEILGYPVRFTELAKQPVVGNFQWAQLNYDIASATYEQWKDYDKGINYFQVTAYFDHRILLASAFRIAEVTSK